MDMDEDRKLSRLSDGVPRMPRRLTHREKCADQVYLYLQLGSRVLFVFAGILGYSWEGFPGATALAVTGYIVGWWIRRSLGIRRPKALGFFVRMCERAHGSRRGVLEWVIENMRENELTLQKCSAICDVYENAMMKLQNGADAATETRVLQDLDRRVKEISYD
jgi:hypothetical protein